MTTFTVEQIRKINELAMSLQKNGKVPNLARGIEKAKDMLIPPGERMRSAKELADEVEKIKRELESVKVPVAMAPDFSSMGQVADFSSKEFGTEEKIHASVAGLISGSADTSVVLGQGDSEDAEADDEGEIDNFEDLSDLDDAIAFQQGTLGEVEKEDEEAINESVANLETDEDINKDISKEIVRSQEGVSTSDFFIPAETPPISENDGLLKDTGYQNDEALVQESPSLKEAQDMMAEPIEEQGDGSSGDERDGTDTMQGIPPISAPPMETAEGPLPEIAQDIPFQENSEENVPPQNDMDVIDVTGEALGVLEGSDSQEPALPTPNLDEREDQAAIDEVPSPSDTEEGFTQGSQAIDETKAQDNGKGAGAMMPVEDKKPEARDNETKDHKKEVLYDDPSFDISKELKTVEELFSEEEKKEHLQGKEEKFIRDDAED